MRISIRRPLGFSHIGMKDNQEDSVYPLFENADTDQRCFVLCDGVGGSEHGEKASRTVCDVIGAYFDKLLRQGEGVCVDESDVHNAVAEAYDALDALDKSDNANSMATTLTCVCIHSDGIMAAHMGDSRIYLLRPNSGIIYQSSDHSLVNTLLQAGELTQEEAKTFPRKNVITRALQPHAGKRCKTEVHQLTDIRCGDYLFLCCDGILERLTNDKLVEIISSRTTDKEKIKQIENVCMGKTRDNFTAYLIPIDGVEGVSSIKNDDLMPVAIEKHGDDENVSISPVNVERKSLSKRFFGFFKSKVL